MTHCSSGDVHDRSVEKRNVSVYVCCSRGSWRVREAAVHLAQHVLLTCAAHFQANVCLDLQDDKFTPMSLRYHDTVAGFQWSLGDTEAADMLYRRKSIKTFVFVDGTGQRDSLPALFTFRLQQRRNVQTVMGYLEGQPDVFSRLSR